MLLINAKSGNEYVIEKVVNLVAKQKLTRLGFNLGERLILKSCSKIGVIVEIDGVTFGLSEQLAKKIMVKQV